MFNTSNTSGSVTNVAGNFIVNGDYITHADKEQEWEERERRVENEWRVEREKVEREEEREKMEGERREERTAREEERKEERDRGMFICCYTLVGLLMAYVMKPSRRKFVSG